MSIKCRHFGRSSHSPVCWRTAILACIFLINYRPLAAQTSDPAAAQAAAGWEAYEAGQLNQAKTLLEGAVGLSPVNADYQAALGEIDTKLGQEDEAIRHFRRAILLNPADTEFRFGLGQLLQRRGDDREALRILELANPSPELADAWHFTRGFSLFRLGNYLSARDEFKLLVQKPQFRAPASFFLGNIAYAQDRFDEAEPYLATAVETGDVQGNRAYNLYTYDYGLTLFKLGKFAEADRQFRASIAQCDKDPLPWMFLGRCEEELGNYPEAIDMLETSIKTDSTFQLSYYELARLQQRHGDPKKAAELFQLISEKKMEEVSNEQKRAMKLKTVSRPQ